MRLHELLDSEWDPGFEQNEKQEEEMQRWWAKITNIARFSECKIYGRKFDMVRITCWAAQPDRLLTFIAYLYENYE